MKVKKKASYLSAKCSFIDKKRVFIDEFKESVLKKEKTLTVEY